MRYLVLSDIHANQIAFEAVLRHAGRQRWGGVPFLGDVVGYYPEPEAATRTLRGQGYPEALAVRLEVGR
jgi:predicted phosphodiesterase